MEVEEELVKLEEELYETVVRFVRKNETIIDLAVDMIKNMNLDTKSFVSGFLAGRLVSLMQYFMFIPNADGHTFTVQPNLHRVYIDLEKFLNTSRRILEEEYKNIDRTSGGDVY